jgi:hypothetical protein
MTTMSGAFLICLGLLPQPETIKFFVTWYWEYDTATRRSVRFKWLESNRRRVLRVVQKLEQQKAVNLTAFKQLNCLVTSPELPGTGAALYATPSSYDLVTLFSARLRCVRSTALA